MIVVLTSSLSAGRFHYEKQFWQRRTRTSMGTSATHTSWITPSEERVAGFGTSRDRASSCEQHCRPSQKASRDCQVRLLSILVVISCAAEAIDLQTYLQPFICNYYFLMLHFVLILSFQVERTIYVERARRVGGETQGS